ncbi:hypothetical protein ACWELB_43445 [Streptomyces asiaticus]
MSTGEDRGRIGACAHRPPFGEKLRAELGSPRRARGLDSSPRSRVWRAELSGTPVVVKGVPGGVGQAVHEVVQLGPYRRWHRAAERPGEPEEGADVFCRGAGPDGEEADWRWGTATARQRLVHRLGIVGRMTVNGGELEHLGRLAMAMRGAMLTRWPALRPLPSRRA